MFLFSNSLAEMEALFYASLMKVKLREISGQFISEVISGEDPKNNFSFANETI